MFKFVLLFSNAINNSLFVSYEKIGQIQVIFNALRAVLIKRLQVRFGYKKGFLVKRFNDSFVQFLLISTRLQC